MDIFLQDALLDLQVNGLNYQFSLDPSGALGFSLDLLSIEVDSLEPDSLLILHRAQFVRYLVDLHFCFSETGC